jgi:hypothetical protein
MKTRTKKYNTDNGIGIITEYLLKQLNQLRDTAKNDNRAFKLQTLLWYCVDEMEKI